MISCRIEEGVLRVGVVILQQIAKSSRLSGSWKAFCRKHTLIAFWL